MNLPEILQKFDGKEIDVSSMPGYQKWALGYYATTDQITDPSLYVTLQFEITNALEIYRQNFASTSGASFTAYLIWRLVQSMGQCEPFHYRFLEGKWYRLKNPPILIPVATGGQERFREVVLEKVGEKTWNEFVAEYRYGISEALAGRSLQTGHHSEKIYFISTLIGNLPHLQFTSLQPHQHTHSLQTGRNYVYFGKRYSQAEKSFIPFSISLHHGNTDPFLLDQLLQKFGKNLTAPN